MSIACLIMEDSDTHLHSTEWPAGVTEGYIQLTLWRQNIQSENTTQIVYYQTQADWLWPEVPVSKVPPAQQLIGGF